MKYFKWFLILGGTVGLGWYIFIKDHHHRITFNSNQPVGVFYRHLLDWDQFAADDIDSVVLENNVPFNSVSHKVYVQDSIFSYRWVLEPSGTKSTKVTAYVNDEKFAFQQKWQVPFMKNNFVKRNIRNAESVARRMIENAKNFRLSEVSDTVLQPVFAAYVDLETKADTKASNMIRNIGSVMGYIN